MKRKVINVRVKNFRDYLKIVNGLVGLTNTEMIVLEAFLILHFRIKESKLDISVFSTEMKKKVADSLGWENFNQLNMYLKKLTDKEALIKEDNDYEFAEIVLPKKEDQIAINITYP